jgi:hypothetical protein
MASSLLSSYRKQQQEPRHPIPKNSLLLRLFSFFPLSLFKIQAELAKNHGGFLFHRLFTPNPSFIKTNGRFRLHRLAPNPFFISPGWILPHSTKPTKTNKQTNPELSLSLSQTHTTQEQQIIPTSEEEEESKEEKTTRKTKRDSSL